MEHSQENRHIYRDVGQFPSLPVFFFSCCPFAKHLYSFCPRPVFLLSGSLSLSIIALVLTPPPAAFFYKIIGIFSQSKLSSYIKLQAQFPVGSICSMSLLTNFLFVKSSCG